jgi:hypothetical protein
MTPAVPVRQILTVPRAVRQRQYRPADRLGEGGLGVNDPVFCMMPGVCRG